MDLFDETKQIQLNGGMQTCNGSRRSVSMFIRQQPGADLTPSARRGAGFPWGGA